MTSRDNDIANELRELIPDAEWPGLTPAPGEVPAGYFGQLPGLILQKVRAAEVQEELQSLSPILAEAPRSVPLSVPPDYFSQLTQQVIQYITAETAPDQLPSFLADLPRVFPISAPEGYFDSLPEQLLQKIHTADAREELTELSPLLAAAPKVMPNTVPAGYFDQLSSNVLAGINDAPANTSAAAAQTAATNKPIIRSINRRPYMKWAVAASLITLVSASTIYFVKENRRSERMIENTLAGISDQEIMEYLQSHSDAFDKEELTSYSYAPSVEENTNITEVDELPAEAIQLYLDNTSLLKEH